MFDPATTDLIQQASPLEGLDLDRLPQFLTEAYAKVTAFIAKDFVGTSFARPWRKAA